MTGDRVFGPLVVFGLSGAATEVLTDQAARLTPLTDTDADALIRSVRAAPLLLGHRGVPVIDLAALRELLLRVSRSPMTCPRSPSSTSARSSPGRTGWSRWTRGSR